MFTPVREQSDNRRKVSLKHKRTASTDRTRLGGVMSYVQTKGRGPCSTGESDVYHRGDGIKRSMAGKAGTGKPPGFGLRQGD